MNRLNMITPSLPKYFCLAGLYIKKLLNRKIAKFEDFLIYEIEKNLKFTLKVETAILYLFALSYTDGEFQRLERLGKIVIKNNFVDFLIKREQIILCEIMIWYKNKEFCTIYFDKVKSIVNSVELERITLLKFWRFSPNEKIVRDVIKTELGRGYLPWISDYVKGFCYYSLSDVENAKRHLQIALEKMPAAEQAYVDLYTLLNGKDFYF